MLGFAIGQKSAGGDGGPAGGSGFGAGFGGAVFAMSQVTLTLGGTGNISGNQARADQPAACAGDGIFLQGAGTLAFAPDADGTYTVLDKITDECGAVRDHHVAAADKTTRRGADGLWATGGAGIWNVQVDGPGTLALTGPHEFTGSINVAKGSVDLSAYSNTAVTAVTLAKQTTLVVAPARPSAAGITLGALALADDATIRLSEGASLSVAGISQARGTLTIAVKADKVPPAATRVAVITSSSSLAGLNCKAAAGYQAEIDKKDGKSIVVTAGSANA
jgi:autotransporter-associated beta strand protein